MDHFRIFAPDVLPCLPPAPVRSETRSLLTQLNARDVAPHIHIHAPSREQENRAIFVDIFFCHPNLHFLLCTLNVPFQTFGCLVDIVEKARQRLNVRREERSEDDCGFVRGFWSFTKIESQSIARLPRGSSVRVAQAACRRSNRPVSGSYVGSWLYESVSTSFSKISDECRPSSSSTARNDLGLANEQANVCRTNVRTYA